MSPVAGSVAKMLKHFFFIWPFFFSVHIPALILHACFPFYMPIFFTVSIIKLDMKESYYDQFEM